MPRNLFTSGGKRLLLVVLGTFILLLGVAGIEQIIKPNDRATVQSAPSLSAATECPITFSFSGIYCLVTKSELLKLAETFSIVIAAWFFITDSKERKEQVIRENWSLIDGARGSETSGARFRAIQKLHQEGASLQSIDAEGANLRGIELSKADLRLSNFQGANLENAILVEVILQESNLREAKLKEINLKRAKMWGVDLRDADLTDAILKDAWLGSSKFSRAVMRRVNLEGAKLNGARLYYNDFKDANFEGADLTGAKFKGAKNLNFDQIATAENWRNALFSEDILPENRDLPREKSITLDLEPPIPKKISQLEESEDRIDETVHEIRSRISEFLDNMERYPSEISEVRSLSELKQLFDLMQSLRDMQKDVQQRNQELQDLIDNDLDQ
jgi:uncharacterized protein YjbI with pentapeptide repeats